MKSFEEMTLWLCFRGPDIRIFEGNSVNLVDVRPETSIASRVCTYEGQVHLLEAVCEIFRVRIPPAETGDVRTFGQLYRLATSVHERESAFP